MGNNGSQPSALSLTVLQKWEEKHRKRDAEGKTEVSKSESKRNILRWFISLAMIRWQMHAFAPFKILIAKNISMNESKGKEILPAWMMHEDTRHVRQMGWFFFSCVCCLVECEHANLLIHALKATFINHYAIMLHLTMCCNSLTTEESLLAGIAY